MKLLVLIAVVVAVLWLARSLRKPATPPAPPKPPPERLPEQEDMVACAQCGVHLPRSEAVPGRGGIFCSEAHRGAFERQQGP